MIRTHAKRPLLWAVLILLVGGAVACGKLLGGGAPEFKVDKKGPIVSGDWGATLLNGQDFTLEDYRGEIVLINLWATWCPPCVAEMPSLESLQIALEEDGLKTLFLSVDETEAEVERFLEDRNLQLPVAVVDSVPEEIFSNAIPATFVLDREGRVIFKHVGAYEWDSLEVIEFLEPLLEGDV